MYRNLGALGGWDLFKVASCMFLESVGTFSTGPFSSRVGEGKGTVGADLVGLRSPRALWDRKLHSPGHGSAGFRQLRLESPATGPYRVRMKLCPGLTVNAQTVGLGLRGGRSRRLTPPLNKV